jgi:hypothetical protein
VEAAGAKGRLSKLTNDTEQNLVLAPGAFWETTLEARVDRFLMQKTPRGKIHVPEESIDVVVSVTDRSERVLTKGFYEFNVDWKMTEEKHCKWCPHLRARKTCMISRSTSDDRGTILGQQAEAYYSKPLRADESCLLSLLAAMTNQS